MNTLLLLLILAILLLREVDDRFGPLALPKKRKKKSGRVPREKRPLPPPGPKLPFPPDEEAKG